MRKMVLLAAPILLSAAGSRAPDSPAAEVSAGCSYMRFGANNSVNQNGASVSVASNFNRWLGLVGDGGGSFGIVLSFGNH